MKCMRRGLCLLLIAGLMLQPFAGELRAQSAPALSGTVRNAATGATNAVVAQGSVPSPTGGLSGSYGASTAPVIKPLPTAATPVIRPLPTANTAATVKPITVPSSTVPATSIAQTGKALGEAVKAVGSLAPAGSHLSGLVSEIDLLEKQINQFVGQANTLQAQTKPLIENGKTIGKIIDSYPQQVDAFKGKYGIPENATLQQEYTGARKWFFEKIGVNQAQADAWTHKIQTSKMYEQIKQPFKPVNIGIAVAAVAGTNILGQLQANGKVDLGEAFKFVGEKRFWGGLAVSGICYSLASMAMASVFPPGLGLLSGFAPMFAGLAASIVGHDIGYNGFDRGIGEILKSIDFVNVIGQAAGSTVGIFVGGQIGLAIGGTLGAFLGPVGSIVGAMLLGRIGANIAQGIKNFFKGDPEAISNALSDATGSLGKATDVVTKVGSVLAVAGGLPASPLTSDLKSSQLKSEYDQAYRAFSAAMATGNQTVIQKTYGELMDVRSRYADHLEKAVSSR